MWENHTLLASYFSGKPISVQVTNAQGTLETQIWQITIPELIANFKAALANQCPAIIKSIWENNTLLASHFCGNPISVQVTNEQGRIEIQTWQFTMPELVANFKAALASKCYAVIKSMWENNTLLASYFSGNPISVEVTNAHGTLETQTWQITMPELIANFKATLAARTPDITKSMWESENSALPNAVQTFDDIKLTELTEKVLSSSKTGKSEFITIFLNFIANKRILEACLNKRTGKNQSKYVKNQVASLNSILASMGSSSGPLIMDHLQAYSVEQRETLLVDNELSDLLDELLENESNIIIPPFNSTPLINNSIFINNKHSRDSEENFKSNKVSRTNSKH